MNYQKLSLITLYQIKTIIRDWSFIIISILSVIIITFLHGITQSNLKDQEWIAISLPSAIPFANAYLVNFLQIIITIFWAGNFLRKNKYSDTNSSLSIRAFSNVELLFGKTLGFLLVMLGLNVLLGVIALLIHLFASESPFAFYPYIFYFFTLTCPTLLFATGLTIFVKGIVHNLVLSGVLLLVFFYFNLFLSSEILYETFNVIALSLPNTFSDITGFFALNSYLLQRCTFFIWGCGLIILSITFINRVPNNAKTNFVFRKIGIGFLVVGIIISGVYIYKHLEQKHERKIAREVFITYQNTPKVNISDHDIIFKQEGYTYLASSKIKLFNQNEQKIDSVILYLNPGLEILKLTAHNKDISYRRNQQVTIIDLTMQPGESRDIEMKYQGKISTALCYAEVEDIDSLATLTRRYYMYNLGLDYYYLRPDYTLLTPECLWYPSSKSPVNVISPYFSDQDFTRFKLSVKSENRRIPIAQGEEYREGENIYFTNKTGLPGLTLTIGDYARKSIREEEVLYEVFLFKGHEYLLPQKINPKEIIKYWIEKQRFDRDEIYIFDKLNLIETPIHFCAYGRSWKNNSEYIHPEIIYRPERETSFHKFSLKPNKKSNDQAGDFFRMFFHILFDDKRDVPIGNIFKGQLISKRSSKISNENNISCLLQKYHYRVYSSEFIGIDIVFHMMQKGFAYNFEAGGSDISIIRYFMEHNLEELLQKDIEMENALAYKCYYFFKYLLCDIPYQKFKQFNSNFLETHAFQSFSYETYCKEVEQQFGKNLLNLTRQLYYNKGLPAFYFRDEKIEIVKSTDEIEGYVFSFKVWNKGKIDGLISLNNNSRDTWRNYIIPANTCKEIKVYFKDKSESPKIELNMNLAQNIPASHSFKDFSDKENTTKPIEGFFDTDTLAFTPEPGIYIVDNEDPGFHVIEDSRILESKYKRNIYRYKDTYWNWMCFEGAYGELVGSFLEKVSGKGISAIEWEVNLSETGMYELFVYNNKSFAQMRHMVSRNGKKEKKDPEQIYRFVHANGKEEIKIFPLDAEQGWVSLGAYHFNSGITKINLSGQGADQYQYVIADAAKWVKIK